MRALISWLVWAGLCISPVQAAIDYQLQSDELIAQLQVADQPQLSLSKTLVDVFVQHQQQAAQRHGQPVTARLVVQQLLDDAVLAAHAQQRYDAEQLWPKQRVGFDYQVDRQRQQAALLRGYYGQAIEQAIKALPDGSLASVVQWQSELDLKPLTLQPGLTIDLTPDQRQQAGQMIVVSTDFNQDGEPEQHITALDIYQRQNVQGRLALQQGDVDYLKAQARQRVGELFIQHWVQQRWSHADWQALEQVLVNQQLAQRLRQLVGVYADIHDDNPALRAAAEQVTDKQLQQAYARHRDDFKVVERAKVQRIQLADQHSADRVYQALQKGLNFEQAATRYSLTNDTELGWLQRSDQPRSWMHSVAFTQPEGHISKPFRSPQNTGPVVYEIVRIVAREDGFLPLSDAGVRYELAREIAAQQLLQNYQQLQQRLRQQATISLNQRLAGAS
ncbi:hypothetical protein GCM10011297_20520 [Bacterioplanes sanyensis]|uniref:peptidylprolyl isomerase n=1 Tax=Bacterioplanes sanyensis TaxID=1249553 RepID=UPI00167C0A45|nr:peptidyl-prolyl cis-trans isomerase [Bacterioplanes sanyensis]GGY47597.1 hypothetical protein GCM10011297_20520 [Bacterioplanes sanyensis]